MYIMMYNDYIYRMSLAFKNKKTKLTNGNGIQLFDNVYIVLTKFDNLLR